MQYEFLLRIAIAGCCGLVIGYERKSRMKEAGIRTHFVVAIGAALMMVISKYGFQDVLGWSNLALDPSRIAAQVVSGVGFLGAGMIFTQKQTVKGLTTAAGIWATAGIGMAIGSGLLVIGIGVTLFIIAAQILLHSRLWLTASKTEQVILRLDDQPGSVDTIRRLLREKRIQILNFKVEKYQETSDIVMEITAKFPKGIGTDHLLVLVQELSVVHAIEVQ